VAHEFHISVTPLGKDEYLVRIERVAPGVPLAEEQVHWPVEDWLVQARQLMNDPLLGVLQGNSPGVPDIFFLPEWEEPVSESSLNLVALGQQLYNALFQGSLRDSWMMAQAIAQNQRSVLRLRLGLKGTRLPRLPWEVLHGGDRPLATGTDVAFSRYQQSTGLIRPISISPSGHQPLKILMVISGPSDQETLELTQEANHLQEELKNRSANESPAIQLTILEQPGREQLTQSLEQGQYQVFHYAGHSNLGDSGGDVYLVSNKTGLTETLNGDDLAGLLVNNGVQLAVFNSCRGAYTAASDILENGKERNLAEALVKRGIPGVLAMAERIPDGVALTLTRLLYRNLNQGYPIDLSLSRARQGLVSAYGSNQLYWALPVLYLHPEFNGFLRNDDDPDRREELFALPDPLEISLRSSPLEDPSIAPPRLNSTSFLDMEDESDLPYLSEFAGDEGQGLSGFSDGLDLDDPSGDDSEAFIKNLLEQLNIQPASSEPMRSAMDIDSRSPEGSDPVELKWPANSANDLSFPPKESAATVSPPGVLPPQSENWADSAKAVSHGKKGGLKSWWQKLRGFPKLWIGLGAMGVLAIALGGFWWFQQRELRPEASLPANSPIPSLPQTPTNPQNVDLKTADTSKVTEIAIARLSQGNLPQGQKAVEELLNRGALKQASAALAVIPKGQLDQPAVSFLRGRLAWQSVQAGNQDFDLSDARRFWETAHKGQPKSATYLTALGFAYYAEGKFDRADQAWFDALLYVSAATSKGRQVATSPANRETLNIYAGLALGMWQSAKQQPADQRAKLLRASLKLRQKVITDDPVNFQPEALSKNWLWSEKAIQDWRSLLATSK